MVERSPLMLDIGIRSPVARQKVVSVTGHGDDHYERKKKLKGFSNKEITYKMITIETGS